MSVPVRCGMAIMQYFQISSNTTSSYALLLIRQHCQVAYPSLQNRVSTSARDISVSWNDRQKQVGGILPIAVDFMECWFAVADVPHHIICLRVGRNIDA